MTFRGVQPAFSPLNSL